MNNLASVITKASEAMLPKIFSTVGWGAIHTVKSAFATLFGMASPSVLLYLGQAKTEAPLLVKAFSEKNIDTPCLSVQMGYILLQHYQSDNKLAGLMKIIGIIASGILLYWPQQEWWDILKVTVSSINIALRSCSFSSDKIGPIGAVLKEYGFQCSLLSLNSITYDIADSHKSLALTLAKSTSHLLFKEGWAFKNNLIASFFDVAASMGAASCAHKCQVISKNESNKTNENDIIPKFNNLTLKGAWWPVVSDILHLVFDEHIDRSIAWILKGNNYKKTAQLTLPEEIKMLAGITEKKIMTERGEEDGKVNEEGNFSYDFMGMFMENYANHLVNKLALSISDGLMGDRYL